MQTRSLACALRRCDHPESLGSRALRGLLGSLAFPFGVVA